MSSWDHSKARNRTPRTRASFALAALLGALTLGAALAPSEADAAPEESPLGYIEMPEAEDGAWVLASRPGSGRNWAQPVFVRYLVLVAREWKRRHPEGPVLRIGDLSKPDGSNFPPHKTHKDGLTADLFTYPKNACHVNFEDQTLTLELAQLMFDLGARQILYNGDLVVRSIGVAQKWPKHDDHFHIVIDPSRVPDDGALVVLPAEDVRDGGWVGGSALDEGGAGLRLRWRVLGTTRLKSYRVLVEELPAQGDEGRVVHDSGPLRATPTEYALPLALSHGGRYRWKVELELADGGVAGFGWQRLGVDLAPPTVTVSGPPEDQDQDGPPRLAWRYVKDGVPQGSYRIELDKDPSHRRIWATLGPFDSAAGSHVLVDAPLRRNKRYHWRVVVQDARGNEAASPWATFETSGSFSREAAPDEQARGTITANALNLRAGPGTGHDVVASLPQGTEVVILREADGWLEVQAEHDGRPVRGFVASRYVERD